MPADYGYLNGEEQSLELPTGMHVGLAGESWVESMMLRQGYTVARMPPNLPRIDLLARRAGTDWFSVQVKASMNNHVVNMGKIGRGDVAPPDIFVFLRIDPKDPLAEPVPVIVPGGVVWQWVQSSYYALWYGPTCHVRWAALEESFRAHAGLVGACNDLCVAVVQAQNQPVIAWHQFGQFGGAHRMIRGAEIDLAVVVA